MLNLYSYQTVSLCRTNWQLGTAPPLCFSNHSIVPCCWSSGLCKICSAVSPPNATYLINRVRIMFVEISLREVSLLFTVQTISGEETSVITLLSKSLWDYSKHLEVLYDTWPQDHRQHIDQVGSCSTSE